MSTPVLQVISLSAEKNGFPVLQNIKLCVRAGERWAIVGPNGAGKSSLLKALRGEDSSSWGEVLYWGGPLRDAYKKVASIPQVHDVDWDFPIRVSDVVLQGRFPHLGLFKTPTLKDHRKVEESLRRVGLWDLRSRNVYQLSGGQKQRMFLARALAQDAELFLMDEPTSGLDVRSEETFMSLLKELSESPDSRASFLVVHHNLFSVKAHFEKVLLLNVLSYGAGDLSEVLTEDNISRAYRAQSPQDVVKR